MIKSILIPLIQDKPMETEPSNPQAAVEAAMKLVQVLNPLNSQDRHRAITAAMVLLGDALQQTNSVAPAVKAAGEESAPRVEGISSKGMAWMKKNGITREQLDHVFSIEAEGIEVIASQLPGASKRQQTVEAYVICGLKSLLQIGEPNFTDKDARAVCSKVGCYDIGNHSNYMNALGNLVSGSRETGWKLSNPGLSRAGEIVRLLAPGGSS